MIARNYGRRMDNDYFIGIGFPFEVMKNVQLYTYICKHTCIHTVVFNDHQLITLEPTVFCNNIKPSAESM